MSKIRRNSGSAKAVKGEDVDFQILFYENILQNSPNFVEALMVLGNLYTKKGLYEKGLEMDLRLSQVRTDNPFVFYNLACSYALTDNPEKAFEAIKQAIDLGFDAVDHIQNDADLENLLSYPPFKEYMAQLQSKPTQPRIQLRRFIN